MAGGDGVTLPPVERPVIPEPVEKANKDRERQRKQREQKKKPRSDEPEPPPEDGKGERVNIRA